jgi:hypothetical protein
VAERRIRLNQSTTGLHASVGRDQAGNLTRQPDRFAIVRLRRVVRCIGIEVAQDGCHRAQDVHAVRCRQLLHQAEDALRERTRGGEL